MTILRRLKREPGRHHPRILGWWRPVGSARPGEIGRCDDQRMTSIAPTLAHHYHQRFGQFVSVEQFGEWRLKLYGLAAPQLGVRPALVETTRRLARREPAAGRR